MNKQELIKKYEMKGEQLKEFPVVAIGDVLKNLRELDEPKSGHADEAPRYVKNVLARLRELPLHNREVWLEAIMSEFGQDFNNAKWREGYEQGKLEGAWVGDQLKDADKIRCELNQVKVPQFVADWYEENKDDFETSLFQCIYEILKKRNDNELNEIEKWVINENTEPFKTLVNMHQFGYEVEKEKRYRVKMLKANFDGKIQILSFKKNSFFWSSNWEGYKVHHTQKQLEEADFGWVFDCPGVEIEEVKE